MIAEKRSKIEHENGHFFIQKIYIKDMNFKSPSSPSVFKLPWESTVDMNLNSKANQLEDDAFFEVALSVKLTVSAKEKIVYKVAVQYAGIFEIKNIVPENLEKILEVNCPNILFPFARELISDLVIRGGFPQLLLAPINFENIFIRKQQQQLLVDNPSTTTH